MSITTPLRESVLENVKNDLKAISIANGYRTNPKVSRVLKKIDEITEFPFLFVVDAGSVITEDTNKEIKDLMTIIIYGAVSFSGHAEIDQIASTQLNNLIADVIEKLYADIERGGYAVMTSVKVIKTDKGSLEPRAEVEIHVDIEIDVKATDLGQKLL